MRRQRIAVIGAGTAGLATALLLARQGHEITLIERAPALAAAGAGILLQPSGLGVLSKLGCLDALLRCGQRIDGLYGQTRRGRKIMQVEYAHLGGVAHRFGLGVHRMALCHALDAVLAQVPHRRWFGCTVQSLEPAADRQLVRFEHGGASHHAAFDAVLVANGAASQLRPRAWVRYDRPYPWGAMWLIRPCTPALSPFRAPRLVQRYDGAHTMIGVLPTGCVPDEPQVPLLSLFWSVPAQEIPLWRDAERDLSPWRRRIIGLWPELAPLVEAITRPTELLPATYRDVALKRWGAGRVGIIGDAAHAMSPQLGQGANLALLDADALAQAVASSDGWDAVWQRFASMRAGSIHFYQAASRLLTPFFQSGSAGIAWVRDGALPWAYRIPWMRRQAAATVAGLKQGWILG